MVGLLSGLVLLALGLIPGLFQTFTDGVQNFLASISSPYPVHPHLRNQQQWRPVWLAVAGAMLILLSMAEYLRLLR